MLIINNNVDKTVCISNINKTFFFVHILIAHDDLYRTVWLAKSHTRPNRIIYEEINVKRFRPLVFIILLYNIYVCKLYTYVIFTDIVLNENNERSISL